jgi:fatty-acid peroxygenase
MTQIPRDHSIDATADLVAEGYEFVTRRCQALHSDLFETRLLLRPTLCMLGPDAAELFYDEDKMVREGSAPTRQMSSSLMTPDAIDDLEERLAVQWNAALPKWEARGTIVLFDELQKVFFRAACAWAGVPLHFIEVARRTRDIGAMIQGAGGWAWAYLRARRARTRAERWVGDIIERVRTGELEPPVERALHVIANHRDGRGHLLSVHRASVELLNVLRPIVAVARDATFAALALHEHPEARARIEDRDERYLQWFVLETRRFYPFFPFVAARVRKTFRWGQYTLPAGRRVLFDLYGTNHDPRLWSQPERFHPERFESWAGGRFDLVPQGGGDHATGHRCAGEGVTERLTQRATKLLTGAMSYAVPGQDLRVPLSMMPALPRSRFIVDNVRQKARSKQNAAARGSLRVVSAGRAC